MEERTPEREAALIADLHPMQITVGPREVTRQRDISRARLTTDFNTALKEAGLLALSEEAHGLPGWNSGQPALADFARHRPVQNATA